MKTETKSQRLLAFFMARPAIDMFLAAMYVAAIAAILMDVFVWRP